MLSRLLNPDKSEDISMTIRDRGWRRLQKIIKDTRRSPHISNKWKREKNWKLLYTRSVKLCIAQKLGNEYPKKTVCQVLAQNE